MCCEKGTAVIAGGGSKTDVRNLLEGRRVARMQKMGLLKSFHDGHPFRCSAKVSWNSCSLLPQSLCLPSEQCLFLFLSLEQCLGLRGKPEHRGRRGPGKQKQELIFIHTLREGESWIQGRRIQRLYREFRWLYDPASGLIEKWSGWAGEIAQWLRVCTALAEDWHSVPRTRVEQLMTACNSSSNQGN